MLWPLIEIVLEIVLASLSLAVDKEFWQKPRQTQDLATMLAK